MTESESTWPSHRRFDELAALLPETVFEMDVAGRITYINTAGLAQFGYTQDEATSGLTALDVIVPSEHRRVMDYLVRLFAGERIPQREYTFLRKSGLTFSGRVFSTVRYHNGQPASLLGIVIDSSRDQALESRLREWEDRYRVAAGAGLTGVWEHNFETGEMVIDANLKGLLGFDQDGIMRWDAWIPLIHPDDVPILLERTRDFVTGRIPRFEVQSRVCLPEEEMRWILIRGMAKRDETGWVQRLIGSATDITQLREVEKEMAQAKDDLEARVRLRTHELRQANKTLRSVIREKTETARSLKRREAELEMKTAKLEDLNTALRFLLKKLDREKKAMEEKITADLRDLIHPYLKKLGRKSKDREIDVLVTILDNHLKAIVSPFSRYLTSPSINLTPAELTVANMVKEGHSTRQIAEKLNLAYKTVETHRGNIRKKLGLTRKGGNLRTCLMAMEKPRL